MGSFGKVGVLMGGQSAEREISLMSGEGVLKALISKGIDAHKVDVGDDIIDVLCRENYDRVFNVLHGPMGEDGTIQGVLELLRIPYTGSGVLGCAVAMDKGRSKLIFQGLGLPTADFVVLDLSQNIRNQLKHMSLPLVVKPVFEGSSIGTTKLVDWADLNRSIEAAMPYGDIMVEQWIEGKEFTVGIIGQKVLPPAQITVREGFYDYQNKYTAGKTEYSCPCDLDQTKLTELQELAYAAFVSIGCSGWGRVDVMQDLTGHFYVLEVNPNTGMTPTSLVPKEAEVIGWSYEDLVLEVLKLTQ